MSLITGLLLFLSIALSSGRNILSKNISDFSLGTKKFYLSQAIIFFSGSLVLMIFGTDFSSISLITVLYAIIYGLLLIAAQWCYTVALKGGKTAVCSTVYSLGFIFPTLSGCLFWNEKVTLVNLIGVLMVIPAIIVSGMKSSDSKIENDSYIIPLVIAMLSSGGLGIMQKVQQFSQYPEQKGVFVFVAFALSGIISLLFALFAKADSKDISSKKYIAASGTGICFATCNLLNTTLAGKLDSAVFFPSLNIGSILLSLFLGLIIYKEKLTKKDLVVLGLGVISILLINLG